MKTCLINRCERPAECRGLCHPCYQAAWRYIKSGATTWKTLEENGFALPAGKKGREKGTFRKTLDFIRLTSDEQYLATLKAGNKVTVEANEPLIRHMEKKIESGKETLGSKLVKVSNIGRQVQDEASTNYEPSESTDGPYPIPMPDEYTGPPLATERKPDELGLKTIQDLAPIIEGMVPERVPTMSGFPAEPLSDPKLDKTIIESTPVQHDPVIENFFRTLPDQHSGQKPG